MPKKPDTALYFTTIAAINEEFAVVGGHLYTEADEPSITRFMLCFGDEWQHLEDLDDVSYAIEKKPGTRANARGTLCLLGRAGLYREIVSGREPTDSRIDITDAGYLMDLRFIGSHLYACGGQNQVHRQEKAQWRKTDQGIFKPIGDTLDRSLEAIDGFSEEDIYAVGSGGSIWHWDGKRWTGLDSPTNYPFYCVKCASGGDVYVGGSAGLLFRGNREAGWADISDSSVTEDVIEDLTEFQGRIYATATDLLLVTDGGPVQAVNVPIKGKKAFYTIDSTKDIMWIAGDEWVFRFDGSKWEKFSCPENR